MESKLICEICAVSDFDIVWLPDKTGAPVLASNLRVCRICRGVYLLRSPSPAPVNRRHPVGPGESE